MSVSIVKGRQRWVVMCDPITVAQIKVLAATSKQTVGYTLDQAVNYFSRKVRFTGEKPLDWQLPDDY